MTSDPDQRRLGELLAAADRFDALADTAELMGDQPGAERFRAEANGCRMTAMRALDE